MKTNKHLWGHYLLISDPHLKVFLFRFQRWRLCFFEDFPTFWLENLHIFNFCFDLYYSVHKNITKGKRCLLSVHRTVAFCLPTGGYLGIAGKPEFPVSLRHTQSTYVFFLDTKGHSVTRNRDSGIWAISGSPRTMLYFSCIDCVSSKSY